MSKMKYTERNVPEGIEVRVQHIRGNIVPGRWLTRCKLIDAATGAVVGKAVARCNPKDNPSRKIGRAIAVGRALKRYHESRPT